MRVLAISDVCGRADALQRLAKLTPELNIDLVLFAGNALAGGRRVQEWLRAQAEGHPVRRYSAELAAQEREDARVLDAVLDALSAFEKPVMLVPGDLDAPERLFLQAAIGHQLVSPNLVCVHRSFAWAPRNYAVAGFGGLIAHGERETDFVLRYPAWEALTGLDFVRRIERELILLLHTPPRFGDLDLHGGGHVGDPVVEEMVNTYNPRLVVVGHAADGQGMVELGRSLVVNPGPLCRGDYALIDVDTRKVTFYKLEGAEFEQSAEDRDIQARVERALASEAETQGAPITVRVRDGIARLLGTVASIQAKATAERVASSVEGVIRVDNALSADTALAARVISRLASDPRTSLAPIEVVCQGGQVTLSGTVPSTEVKRAATDVAWSVPGVAAVIDEIKVEEGQRAGSGEWPMTEPEEGQEAVGQGAVQLAALRAVTEVGLTRA